jgi:peptidoglycan hydrolase-like protein with peptidoglycan-binding domain
MNKLIISVVSFSLGLIVIWVDPAFAERRVALVIGNSSYQNVPTLADPGKDSQAVAAMFQKAGFDVVSAQSDVGISQFKRAIAQFQDLTDNSDVAVVYYSGYGLDIQGVNYLIPADAKLANARDADAEAITLESVAKSVDGAKRLRLVIVDASRDNPFAKSLKQQVVDRGLAEPEPKPGTLIAFAAAAGSEAEDGDTEHSIYTGALLHNLFTPGLDIRLAFGRVLVDVRKRTSKRQTPFVYGSLGGGNISLVPAPPDRPGIDLAGEKTDYSVVEQIGTAHAWEVFLVQHTTGFYSSVAREQLRLAEAETPQPQSAPPPRPGMNSQQHAALPAVNSPEQVYLAQQELMRLGCFYGAVDGSLNAETIAAIRLYQSARGETHANEAAINDDFISELKEQIARVCPLICPADKVIEGDRCVDVGKSNAVGPRKDEGDHGKPANIGPAKQEKRPTPTPAVAARAPSGSGHGGPQPGVGF